MSKNLFVENIFASGSKIVALIVYWCYSLSIEYLNFITPESHHESVTKNTSLHYLVSTGIQGLAFVYLNISQN